MSLALVTIMACGSIFTKEFEKNLSMIMQTRNISFYEKHVRQMFRTGKENEAVIFKMLHQNVPVIPDTKALLDNFFFIS